MRISHAQIFYTDAEVREYYEHLGGTPAAHVSALNNGIDTSKIQEFREPYVAEGRPKNIFFIGRLEPKARVDELLLALARPDMSDVSLHAIGDGSCSQALRQLAIDLGVSDRAHWYRSTTNEERIAAVANRCRLFVYPGEVGLSLIHSMAYGLPSVVHKDRWTHMPEISAFRDGETGRAFSPKSIDSLSQTVVELISNPVDLECFSSACIETTSVDYNTASMAHRFADAIRLVQVASEKG
jgi:glycosyltransferase involved in cell wall biosynthesis